MDNKKTTSDEMESRRQEWLHLAMLEDATTGHSVTAVAFCDNESRAAVLVQMMNEHKNQATQLTTLTARVAELEGALRGGKHAQSHALDSNLDLIAKMTVEDDYEVMSRMTAAAVLRGYAAMIRDVLSLTSVEIGNAEV